LKEFGLRYIESSTRPGAQTENRGEAGPVSVCLAARPHRLLFL